MRTIHSRQRVSRQVVALSRLWSRHLSFEPSPYIYINIQEEKRKIVACCFVRFLPTAFGFDFTYFLFDPPHLTMTSHQFYQLPQHSDRKGFECLQIQSGPIRTPGPNDVLVNVKACSLN